MVHRRWVAGDWWAYPAVVSYPNGPKSNCAVLRLRHASDPDTAMDLSVLAVESRIKNNNTVCFGENLAVVFAQFLAEYGR